jgi:cysteine dioxygenase
MDFGETSMQATFRVDGPRGKSLNQPLRRLIDCFKGFRDRIPQQELIRLVSAANVTIDSVVDLCHFHDHHYVRNLIHRLPHVEVLCMCWRSGQRSPIHDHNESNCVVQVLEGSMTNTDFKLLPSGYVCPAVSHEYGVGTIEARSEDDIHQVANLQRVGCNLVTLHVYSPPLARVNVFSLDIPNPPRCFYLMEHTFQGDGI